MTLETRNRAMDAVMRQIFTGDHGHVKRVYVITDPEGVVADSICFSKFASERYAGNMWVLYGRRFNIEQVTYEEACQWRGIEDPDLIGATVCCEFDEIIVTESSRGYAVYTKKEGERKRDVLKKGGDDYYVKSNKTKKGTKK